MRSILKFLFIGLIRKPLRSGLLILAIASSAALIFSNAGFSNIVEQKFIEASTRWRGDADVIIFSESEIDQAIYFEYKDDLAFENVLTRTTAIYDDNLHILNIVSSDIEAFNKNNPIKLVEGSIDLEKNDVIISKIFASRYNLTLNSEMKLTVNGEILLLRIKGLADVDGAFLRDDADGNLALVNDETLSELPRNNVFLTFKDGVDASKIAKTIALTYPEYTYDFTFDKGLLNSEVQSFTLPFTLTAFSVMLLGMFIIITSYQIITLERISQIGTIRSIGATKKKVFLSLLIESSLIGLVSGVIGCLLGIGLLMYVKISYYSGPNIAQTKIILYPKDIIIVLIFAVIMAILCAIVPVLKVIGMPVKDMVFGNDNKSEINRGKFWFIGLLFILLPVFIPQFLPRNMVGMIVASVLVFLVLIGVVLIIPKLLDVLVSLFIKLPFLKHEGAMAARNIKDSKYLVNNIKLFAVTIGIISFMSSLFGTLTYDLEKAYTENGYDVFMMTRSENKLTDDELNSIDNLKEYTTSTYVSYTTWEEHDSFLNSINGIKNIKFFDYVNVNIEGAEEAIASLNDGKYVIVTQVLKSKFKLELGDAILLPIEGANYLFEITGFVDTTLEIGHLVYVSYDQLSKMTTRSSEEYFLRSVDDPSYLKNKLMSNWSDKITMIKTREELYAANIDKIQGIFKAINSYSNMALLIGILGVISNIISGFIVRQKTFVQYKCFGMSTNQMKRMLVLEAVIIGFLGYGLGLIASFAMSNSIPSVVALFWGDVEIVSDFFKLFIIGLASIGTMFFIAHVPIKSLEKLNIIERLKCE